jgi:ABC-2 type transport system ATP-binding protein
MDVTGLGPKADSLLSSLSTGTKQKLNFARAFMSDPDIVFLDEPTLGLDVGSRAGHPRIRHAVDRGAPGTDRAPHDALHGRGGRAVRTGGDHRPGQILALDAPRALKRAISSEPVFELQIGTGTAQFEDLRDVIGVRSLSHHAHPGTGAIELRVAVVEDEVIGEVLGRLKERGAPVLNLTKSEPTLETVFVHLVGRGLEDEDTDGQGA